MTLEAARQIVDCIEEEDVPWFAFIAPPDVLLRDDKKTIVQLDIYARIAAFQTAVALGWTHQQYKKRNR